MCIPLTNILRLTRVFNVSAEWYFASPTFEEINCVMRSKNYNYGARWRVLPERAPEVENVGYCVWSMFLVMRERWVSDNQEILSIECFFMVWEALQSSEEEFIPVSPQLLSYVPPSNQNLLSDTSVLHLTTGVLNPLVNFACFWWSGRRYKVPRKNSTWQL